MSSFSSHLMWLLATAAGVAPLGCLSSLPPPTRQPEQAPVPVMDGADEEGQSATIAVPPEASATGTPVSGQFDVAGSVARGWGDRQKNTPPVKTIKLSTRLTKKWTARVGRTTFRTTMALVGDAVVIGTHGGKLDAKNERDDGVYVLEARTGKTRKFIQTPGKGDLDVGGIAVDGNRVYFTTDNSQIVAAALTGAVLWKAKAKGKVRPAPALGDLNGDGHVDVAVGDELGQLRAINGKNGKPLWTVRTGTNDYNAQGFLGAAAIADLNGDGRLDVIAGARDGVLTAYRGADGSVLWQNAHDSGMHASPTVADFDSDGKPEVLAAWSYGDVDIYDGRTGRLRWGTVLRQDDGGIEGLFGTPTPVPGAPGVLLAGTSWWGQKEDGLIGVGVDQRMFKAFEGRVSASAVVTDLDGDGTREAIIGTEKGTLLALRADGGRAVLARLGGAIEAPALLADTDGNGTVEILVASNDGILTCFETGSRAKPDIARFRGTSPHNRGNIGKIRLGWRSTTTAAGTHTTTTSSRGNIRIDYLPCCRELQDSATRAPAPQNALLLRGSALCSTLAASGVERSKAIRQIRTLLPGITLPRACR